MKERRKPSYHFLDKKANVEFMKEEKLINIFR